MAKAADVPTLPDEPFAHAAARIVRVRSQELFEHSAGVMDTEDIERVHAMRVATRRLRAVLEIFAVTFPRKRHRAVLAEVKRLADALGERRDPDVHIAALEAFAASVAPEQRPGADRLIAEQRRRQATGNEVLANALRRMEEIDLRVQLEELADAADAGVRAP
jgi:CHAD domain-containing protein